MDDDARRIRLQRHFGNVGQISAGPSQVPSFLHALDPISGKVAVRLTQGEGVDFFSDNNSQPVAQPREKSGALDFVQGGGSVEAPRQSLPITAFGEGVNFIKLDPNVAIRPNADRRDIRGKDSTAMFG